MTNIHTQLYKPSNCCSLRKQLAMEKHELCILGATRLRRLFLFFGFCFLLIWVLSGSYLHNDDDLITSSSSSTSNIKGLVIGPSSLQDWLKTRKLMAIANEDTAGIKEEFDPTNLNATYDDLECNAIHSTNRSFHCDFVKRVPACAGDDGLIPYFELVYCTMSYKLIPLAMVILVLWLFYLFLFLGTTAESFFCRELAYITKLLRLSPNVAGVTLLAIGNGAPDIFSVIAAFDHPDEKKTSLAFGALFGAGMFVTNIVVGLVCIFRPFQLTKRPFMRDNIFYLFAVFWVFTLLWQNEITLLHAIGMLIYYVAYVLVVVLGSLVYQYWFKWKTARQRNDKPQEQVVRYSNKRIPDSLEFSRHGDVTIHPQEQLEESNGDNNRPTSPNRQIVAKQTDNSPFPAIVVTQNTSDDSSDSDNSTRPLTPSEKSAKKASEKVYCVSDQGNAPRRRVMREGNGIDDEESEMEVPRPRSRLEQLFDNAMYVAEDVIASSNPNLAKVWHTEYDREMVRQRQDRGSRATTPFNPAETPKINEESFTTTVKSNVEIETQLTSGNDNETTPTEKTPLVAPRPHTNEPPPYTDEAPPYTDEAAPPIDSSPHPLRKLIDAIFPFTSVNFKSASLLSKIFQIIKYPLTLVLTLTIPVVDINEPLNNWNKWLTIIQCMTAPVFFSVGAEFGLIFIKGVFPVFVIVFFASILIAVFVALTSSSHKPPIYHCVFAWAGFALSVLWIYMIANEIVNLLQVFGVVAKLSDGILGITLLAWGNSIQDSVTNVTMARQGYPRMAVGACFGGPLLNILIGIGIASMIRSIAEDNKFHIDFTQVTMLAAFFLMLSLCTSLLFISFLQFKMYRLYGVLLFGLYICFLVVVILAELKVFNIKIDGVLSDYD